jgi:hypothetical protein
MRKTKYNQIPPPRTELEEIYTSCGSTLSSVAMKYGTKRHVVRSWLTKYNIPLKSHLQASREANKRDAAPKPSKELLEEAYKSHNFSELEVVFRTSQATLDSWFKEYGIQKRTLGQACKIGRNQMMLDRVKGITNAYEVYKQNRFNKTLTMEALGLNRYELKWLFDRDGIQTVIPWRSRTEVEIYERLCTVDPDGRWRTNDYSLASYEGNRREIDIVSDVRKVAIEYGSIYWHSEIHGDKDNRYHRQKYEACRDKGYRLYTIFDSDDVDTVIDNIVNSLVPGKKIGARECVVGEVPKGECIPFENWHHFSGSVGASVRIGLWHEGHLVSTMSFSKPRFSKGYEWEIARYTVGTGLTVRGGAQRLFRWFVDNHDPVSVMTFSNLRFGEGNVYGRLGMERQRDSSPTYWYWHPERPGKVYSRVKFQKHKLAEQLDRFDQSLSEWTNMQLNGWDRIWDCGNAVWTWRKTG